jgi:hypothetical protein
MNSAPFRKILPLAVLVSGLASAAAATPTLDCALTRAVYTPLDADDDMSADEGVTNAYEITHAPTASDHSDRPWLVRISERRQKLAYDFAVSHPPGFGGAHLVMMPEPKGLQKRSGTERPSSRLFYFGEDLRRVDPEADPAARAPAYVQLPEISPAFWAWKRDGRRFVPPDGIWKLTACRG